MMSIRSLLVCPMLSITCRAHVNQWAAIYMTLFVLRCSIFAVRFLHTPWHIFYALLAHADVLEPDRPAVVAMQPGLAVRQATLDASGALGRVGAVEEGDVLVANVAEPGSHCQMGCPWEKTVKDGEQLTSGSCWRPQTDRGQYCAPAHRPSARRRNRPRGRGG